MFLWNVKKCLEIFDRVYVSSDSSHILDMATGAGAIPISRGEELCGDVPDIPVFKHALQFMGDVGGIVAVHANNPNLDPHIIKLVKLNLEAGAPEVMTCHPMSDDTEEIKNNGIKSGYKTQHSKVNGSVRGMSVERLLNYPDPYRPRPEVLVIDDSIEVEYQEDFDKALGQICDDNGFCKHHLSITQN